MENRFLQTNDYLTRGAARPPRRPLRTPYSRQQSGWATPFAAADRVLVVLIENGGVDLGIPELVDKVLSALPGSSLIPDSARQQLVNAIRERIRSLTDSLIETAELSLNRYAASSPEFFGDVIVLRDGTSSYDDLKRTLIAQSAAGRIIDLVILTHGSGNFISVTGGIDGDRIRAIKTEHGRPLNIRSVYMMNCVGASLNRAWIDAGARVSAGSIANNYLPEPTTFFFWQAWKEGRSFEEAVTSAYKKTINLMNAAVRGFVSALPIPGSGRLADMIDFSTMDFVTDSAPRVEGRGTLTISSDNLAAAQSMASGLAVTVLPASALSMLVRARTLSTAQGRVQPLSPAGLQFLARWEGCPGEPPQALLQRAAALRQTLEGIVTIALNQNQSDALISFVHDIGEEPLRQSKCLERLNAGDAAGAVAEMKKWTKTLRNGAMVDVPRLARRREAEADLFGRPAASLGQSRSLTAVDYHVPGIVPVLKQRTPLVCWAAVFTMLYSWKRGVSVSEREALATAGQKYVDMFDRNQGLDAAGARQLYADAGLVPVESFNPTIEGWESFLKEFGPLYVDVGYPSGNVVHAIIVTGISGDGTAGGTTIAYIDPLTGTTPVIRFADFLVKYEADTAVRWPYTIVHWPAGASLQQSLTVAQTSRYVSPSAVVRAPSNYSMAQNPGALVVAGISVADAAQIGLGAAAVIQAQVAAAQGSFTLSFDKAQRLLTPEARAQMPGSQTTKTRYSRRLFYIGAGKPGLANADIIVEWEGNPYGEISTPFMRRNLQTSTDWSRSSANVTITKLDRIPLPDTDPRAWPLVYSYEGTYDPAGNGHFEFSGEFELNAFGGLKFNRHDVVSRSAVEIAVLGSPDEYVRKGQDVAAAVPAIPNEQVEYLKTRLPS